jgi:hypothetical protein
MVPAAGVDVMAAPLAGVGPPFAHWMEFHLLIANGTVRFVDTVLDLHDASETSRVVRIFGLKLLEGVLGHLLSPYLRLRDSLSNLTCRQGIIPGGYVNWR